MASRVRQGLSRWDDFTQLTPHLFDVLGFRHPWVCSRVQEQSPPPGETCVLSLLRVNSYFWLSSLFLEC